MLLEWACCDCCLSNKWVEGGPTWVITCTRQPIENTDYTFRVTKTIWPMFSVNVWKQRFWNEKVSHTIDIIFNISTTYDKYYYWPMLSIYANIRHSLEDSKQTQWNNVFEVYLQEKTLNISTISVLLLVPLPTNISLT